MRTRYKIIIIRGISVNHLMSGEKLFGLNKLVALVLALMLKLFANYNSLASAPLCLSLLQLIVLIFLVYSHHFYQPHLQQH